MLNDRGRYESYLKDQGQMTTIKEHEELTKTKTNYGVENKRTKERANEITK